jgi:hypothetical protein
MCACGDHYLHLHISLMRTLAQSVVWLWSFVVKHVSSRPGNDPKISKIIFPWESGSDKNGQSKMRGSDARCSYTGVRSAILLSPGGTGSAGKAMACSFRSPGGYLFSPVLLDQGSGTGNSFSSLKTIY